MNGAVYISFFQGQLESVLEQVVQLAVQQISSSVGSSLNALLLETAAKEQENRRLRLQLQASAEDHKNKAGEERGAGGGRKPEPPPGPREPGQRPPGPREPGPRPPGPGARVPPDTRRLEQRGRVVDQLKCVMEQVLDFALRELTKIVEASFDDLLLEITKMDREQALLQDRLGRGGGGGGGGGEPRPRGGGARTRGSAPPGRRRGSENDSVSPSGSDEAREEQAEGVRRTAPPSDPARPPVVSVAQDWVPILDKVFGQKWCGEAWQTKDRGRGPEGAEPGGEPPPSRPVLLQPAPSSPQQDPRWTPLEDMEVFSPDEEEAAEGQRSSGAPPGPPALAPPGAPPDAPPGAPPDAPPSPTGRSPPASMLHRLLTLPSQMLEDDADEEAAARETLVALATNGGEERDGGELPEGPSREEEEEEEEDGEEEEDKGRKKKRRRVWSECEDCGRRFSRASLLKTHRQTHLRDRDSAPLSGDSAPLSGDSAPLSGDSAPLSGDSAPPLCCPHCGRRFSSSARLHSHVRTQHPEGRS